MKINRKDAYQLFENLANNQCENAFKLKYEDTIKAIFWQIEENVEKMQNKVIKEIQNLKKLHNRTLFVGELNKFPKGCISCLCGDGLNAIRKTNKCNLQCKFCYYFGELDSQLKVPEGMWQIGRHEFREEDLDKLLAIQGTPSGIAYAYLEPFIEIEKYYSVIEKFHRAGVYQHLYTNGVLVSEYSLQKLGIAGLDEIRFNLGASNCDNEIIDKIGVAKNYIPSVGIETPMTPDFFEQFFINKRKIMYTNLDFINSAELHLNKNNIINFYGENLYMCRGGYISPISSRLLTLQLMKIASKEKWNFVVHDCSNITKFCRELNYGRKMNLWFGAHYYGMEFETVPFDAFLPIIKDETFPF